MTRWTLAGVIAAMLVAFVIGLFELLWRVCTGDDQISLGPRA